MSCLGTHVGVIEIPEGSWGLRVKTIDNEKISKLIGAPSLAIQEVNNGYPGST
jgi:hypothetical protein